MMDLLIYALAIFVVLGVVYAVFALLRSLFFGAKGDVKHCLTCGHEGQTGKVTRGSFWIEVVLWLCFLIPGLISSIWRLTTRHVACTNCGRSSVVPPSSPNVVAAKARAAAATAPAV